MIMLVRRIRLFLITVLFLPAAIIAGQERPLKLSVDFEKQIRPLLIKHCRECHGPDEQESSLRLDAKHSAMKGGDGGKVIVAGNAKASELVQRIESRDDNDRMPPESRLPAKTIELLRKWIDEGANWPETEYDQQAKVDPRLNHWAFKPVRKVKPPRKYPYTNPIDQFIARRLKEKGIKLSPSADRLTLIRRLTFDLTGLPPTVEEVERFQSDDSEHAYLRAVRRLLASPRYGERWAQHWLDVVRYADTHGFEVNTPRENAWPYRDYVIEAFNNDKPYDQFIREQIAGDAYKKDSATGFLVAAAALLPGQIGADDESKRLARQDELDEMVVGTGATFLGLSIGCARCHDHKFDPISAKDYYAMQAFFAGVDFGEREIRSDSYLQRLEEAKKLGPEIKSIRQTLDGVTPEVFRGHTVLIDETDASRVKYLLKENGPGKNPAGKKRGYLSDLGTASRTANVSGGQYTWWNNQPGKDVMVYQPQIVGKYRLWISWGAHGSGVHTRDARYILDLDGNLETRKDQKELARVDQYYPANVSMGVTEKRPLWSGFLDAGEVELKKDSAIVLRCGKTGTGITADVIALQSSNEVSDSLPSIPRLREPVNYAKNVDRFQPALAKFIRFEVGATDSNNFREPCLDELEVFTSGDNPVNVALRSNGSIATSSGNYGNGTGIHQLAHLNDGNFGNSHSWISNQAGKGWVQIEFEKVNLIDRVVWGRDRQQKFKDRLAIQYRIRISADGRKWTTVASHEDRAPFGSAADPILTMRRLASGSSAKKVSELLARLDKLLARQEQLNQKQLVFAGKFRPPEMSFILRRGNPELRGEPIGPAIPQLFGINLKIEDVSNEQARRMALANWIASPNNPLTARVIVNRIWSYHFGRGLVETPSDFGLNASPPTHPELLDWLALEFINAGWSMKWLHELIVTSETYRQRSIVTKKGLSIDADNRLYWHFPTRRLEAEAIRDSILATTGELNPQMGGPGFNFFKTRGGLSGFPATTEFGSPEFRRMIYAHKIRMEPVPVFGAFDCPDAGQATPRRSRSTTAIQALNLFNSPFMIERANRFAERVIEDVGQEDIGQQISYCFRLALGRPPQSLELQQSTNLVKKHGLAALCRVLFNSSEFLFLP